MSLCLVNDNTLKRDFEAAYHIHKSVQVTPWSFATFADSFKTPYYGVFAYEDGQVIGYAIMLEVLDEATLMDIAVAQSTRGKGVGKALLDLVIRTSCHHLMREIWLDVRESNHTAIGLYLSRGFEHIDIRKNYYTTATGKENALVMKHQCSPSAR